MNFLDEKIYLKIEKHTSKLKDLLEKYPDFNVVTLTSMFFCNDDAKYIKEFSSKNYDKSLNIALKMIEDKKYGEISLNAGVSHVLNALMELKATLPKEEYIKKYGENEIIYKAFANTLFSTQAKNKEGAIKIRYNGIKVDLAYSSYLDGDNIEMKKCLNEHILRYGKEETIEKEYGDRCPWFYKTVSPKYSQFLNEIKKDLQEDKVKSKKIK